MTSIDRRLIVGVLLVLAGCAGLPTQETDTPTLTPAPVPDNGTSSFEERMPPLERPDLRDPGALVEAHATVLENRSYTVAWTRRVEGPNGTLARWNRSLRVTARESRYHYRRQSESAPAYRVSAYRPTLEMWFDGEAVYVRRVTDGEEAYERHQENPLEDPTMVDRLSTLYGAFELRSESVEAGYRATGTDLLEPSALATPPLVVEPHDTRFVHSLTPDGVVSRYRLTYEAIFEDTSPTRGRREPVRVVETAEFRAVGETAVPRPRWYGEARNATSDQERHSRNGGDR